MHTSCKRKQARKKMSLEIFYEKVGEGLLTTAAMEFQVQDQISSPAGRLDGRDYFLHRIPATHAKVEGKSQRSFRVCAERRKWENCKEMYYNVLPKM
jgi:hypothetical protein